MDLSLQMARPPASTRSNTVRLAAASGVSWMALVAATTVGLGHFEHLRAEISADSIVGGVEASYRLIVQTYAPDSFDGERPSARAKPLSSVQRAVTADELRQGIHVDLVQIGAAADHRPAVVIAWVEAGQPDLEFDALTARPQSDAIYGVARIDEDGQMDPARVVLRRSVA